MHVNEDGTVVVATGSPDIGGSRASIGVLAHRQNPEREVLLQTAKEAGIQCGRSIAH